MKANTFTTFPLFLPQTVARYIRTSIAYFFLLTYTLDFFKVSFLFNGYIIFHCTDTPQFLEPAPY